MVKKTEGSFTNSDFIAEFEQLRIKQRLLTQALKKNTNLEETKFEADVNSKLDFLVEVFKDSTSTESEDQHKKEMEVLTQKVSSLESSIQSLSEKFEQLLEKGLSVKSEEKKENLNLLEDKGNLEKESSNQLPPPPDFGNDMDAISSEVKNG